eukprot:1000179_1
MADDEMLEHKATPTTPEHLRPPPIVIEKPVHNGDRSAPDSWASSQTHPLTFWDMLDEEPNEELDISGSNSDQSGQTDHDDDGWQSPGPQRPRRVSNELQISSKVQPPRRKSTKSTDLEICGPSIDDVISPTRSEISNKMQSTKKNMAQALSAISDGVACLDLSTYVSRDRNRFMSPESHTRIRPVSREK